MLIQNPSVPATSSCISYSIDCIEPLTYYYYHYLLLLITITVSITLYQKYDLLLSFSCFQSLFSIWTTELLIANLIVNIFRSSRPEVFCKKIVLGNFAKFTGKHLCERLFFNDVAGLSLATLLKKYLAQVFSWVFSGTDVSIFREHLRWQLLLFGRTLNIAYELNGRKNVCIFGNVIALHIILRNEILWNNGLFKVTSTYNKVAYSATRNIQKFRHIVKSLEKSSRL